MTITRRRRQLTASIFLSYFNLIAHIVTTNHHLPPHIHRTPTANHHRPESQVHSNNINNNIIIIRYLHGGFVADDYSGKPTTRRRIFRFLSQFLPLYVIYLWNRYTIYMYLLLLDDALLMWGRECVVCVLNRLSESDWLHQDGSMHI